MQLAVIQLATNCNVVAKSASTGTVTHKSSAPVGPIVTGSATHRKDLSTGGPAFSDPTGLGDIAVTRVVGTDGLNTPVPAASVVIGAGSVPVSQGPGAALIVNNIATILPGGAAGSVNGVAVSLLPDGSNLVIGASTVPNPIAAFATAAPGLASQFGGASAFVSGMPPMITNGIPGFMIAGQPMQAVNAIQIGDRYLNPGGMLIVANTTMSLPATMVGNASVIVINNVTSTLPNLQRQVAAPTDLSSVPATETSCNAMASITAPPVLVINGRSFVPTVTDSSTYWPISPGQTVRAGDSFTLGGTAVSLDPSATALQVGSSQYTLAPTMAFQPVRAALDMGSGAHSSHRVSALFTVVSIAAGLLGTLIL